MSDDIHEVYAVCYATHARKRSENYIFGDPHDEMTSIAYYVWVIKGPHGTFVCDTGFDDVAAKERARKIIHPVGEGLQALGAAPDKVDHVIATHMHWDHAGNYDLFPNAPRAENGYVARPEGPGLGLEFDEDEARKRPSNDAELPHRYWPDGSVADY